MEIRDNECVRDINVFHITMVVFHPKIGVIFHLINGSTIKFPDKTEIDFVSYKVQIAEEKAKIMGCTKGA